METYHPCARYSYAHAVLEDVSAHIDIDCVIGSVSPSVIGRRALFFDYFHRLGCCQSHCDRLRASKGRLYFLSDQFNDFGFS